MSFLDRRRIQDLLEQVEKPPGYELPEGAEAGVVERARARGVPLPPAFVEWLALTNGPLVGPGGFYGLEPEKPWLDLEKLLDTHPLAVQTRWRERGWVPVAGDGTGNEYVLLPRGDDGPVGFFEMTRSAEAPAYVVSSNLDRFLIGLLERELGGKWWPFDAERMLAFDAGLAEIDPALLPWSA